MLIPKLPSDFELSDDDINEEAAISLIQQEKINILDVIIEKAQLTKQNIELNLPEEEKKSFLILSSYVSSVVELDKLAAEEGLDEDQIYEEISRIKERTTEVSFDDVLSFKKDEENFNPGQLLIKNENNNENNNKKSNDGSLDF